MQDKEMDDLFRSKLENFEVDPSAGVWDNIAEKLGSNRRKKLPYLNIAASVLILVSAGILFFRGHHATPVKNSHSERAGIHPAPVNNTPPKNTQTPGQPDDIKNNNYAATAQTVASKTTTRRNVSIAPAKKVTTRDTAGTETAIAKPAPELVAKAAVPDITFTPTAKPADINLNSFAPKQPVLAANFPQSQQDNASAPVQRHKIHNIGDLINVMIAKVDKRKDKIIQFTDNEDNEASLTGINLGFIKFKKDK